MANKRVVVRECSATFDLLALHEAQRERYPYLLQSAAADTSLARFDILFSFPGKRLTLQLDNTLQCADEDLADNNFLRQLDHWWQSEGSHKNECGDLVDDLAQALPFSGGWFLYLGYELATQIEPNMALDIVLPKQAINKQLPIAYATRIPAAIIHDHHKQQRWLIAEVGTETGCTALLDAMERDITALAPTASAPHPSDLSFVTELQEEPSSRYLSAVEKIKQYIIDGDVFQVNLSRAWRGKMVDGISGVDIYRRLRARNPAPFAGLACYQETAVISSSPERLISVKGECVATRPIAGTRPRGSAAEDDQALSEALLQHPKERAEHIMLIDLERNDLGRLCQPGTIEVDELMVVESYTHVHHIVSNIRGTLRAGVTPGEVIRAVFPGGTITGCPKVRCMEIITELEQTTRGPYTGAMGYLNRDGSMDLNILIRTIVTEAQQISLRAGAGIVADSIAQAELEETRIKAYGLLQALGVDVEK